MGSLFNELKTYNEIKSTSYLFLGIHKNFISYSGTKLI